MASMASSDARPTDTRPQRRGSPGVIPQVFAKHFEEFQFLWEQRRAALRSPDCTVRDVTRLDERLAAHLDGLLLGGEAAIPLLEGGLADDDPSAVFAAAYVLLGLRIQVAADCVAEVFLTGEAKKSEPLGQALCHGPIDLIERVVCDAAASLPASVAAIALEALVFHECPSPAIDRLVEFLEDPNPNVRRCGWRTTAMLGSAAASP
jgi:HEAT repeat protein